MDADKPLFLSLAGAMRWTFASRFEKFGMIARMPLVADGKDDRRRPRGSDYRLDARPIGFDRLGQSGMIKAALNLHLKQIHKHVLVVMFTWGRERYEAQKEVVRFVLPRTSAVIKRPRLVHELVAHAFGKPVKFQSLAIQFHVHPNTVTRQNREVEGLLDQLVTDAVNEATDLLKEQGVIL